MHRATLLVLAAILPIAVLAAEPYERKSGFVIPSQCQPREGGARPSGPYDDWPAPHTTKCALEDACIASGYGLWSEGRFYRFDEKGQALALEYFKSTRRTSYHKLEVLGEFDEKAVAVKGLEPVD